MLDQGTFMFNTRLCSTLVLLLMVNNAMYIDAESVSLLKEPLIGDNSPSVWSWPSTGPSRADSWQKVRHGGHSFNSLQYYNCDRSPTSAPDTWLRSDIILAGVANRIDITIEYSSSTCAFISNPPYCRTDLDLYLHKSIKYRAAGIPDPYTSRDVYEKIGTLSPKVFSQVISAKAENKETHSFVIKKTMPDVVLAFQYKGGCISLHSVSVDYYRCTQKTLSSSLVDLPQTVSPANGSLQVKGSCSQNTKPLTNASNLYGFCKADGEWSTNMYHGQCGCDVGYEKASSGGSGAECKVCPSGTFKDTISNTGCTTCPLNSTQNIDRTSCTCANGYYRTDKETKFENCTAQPSAPQSLVRTFLNATCVTITWSAPSNLGGRTDLYYEAQCKRCNEKGTECTKSCTADISLDGNSRFAIFKHLSAYTFYQFRVLAKNGVSREALKNGENSNSGDLVLRTNDAIPGIPRITVKPLSSTSVFISWTVPEKNGVILYYHVTYYSVGQRPNAKVFNTTFTNATITGLQEPKEYTFEVQAATRVGIGAHVKKTISLQKDEKNQSSTADVTVPVLATMVGLLLFSLSIAAIIIYVRKRRAQGRTQSTKQNNVSQRNEVFVGDADNPQEVSGIGRAEIPDALYLNIEDDTMWQIPRENLSIIKRLGNGNFGYVDKALAIGLPGIPGQITVAVKTLKGTKRG